jgi:hypothetical protein
VGSCRNIAIFQIIWLSVNACYNSNRGRPAKECDLPQREG